MDTQVKILPSGVRTGAPPLHRVKFRRATWVEVAPQLGTETHISTLAVYNGKLYGGTLILAKLYEWNGVNAWVEVAPQLNAQTNLYSLAVYNGKLYGSTYPGGRLFEWNGVNLWVEVAPQLGSETYARKIGRAHV